MNDTSVNKNIKVNQVSSRTHPVRAGINLVDFFIEDCQMKQIPLTQGKVAIVDDELYEWLNQWKWLAHWYKNNNSFYAERIIYLGGGRRNPKRKAVRMHRLILRVKKGQITDHINHDTLDNRRVNLRRCTNAQNLQNQLPRKNTSSKYKGVSWYKSNKKWVASIRLNYKYIYLGCFVSEIKAAEAYDAKAKEIFGEFAYLNFKGDEK